MPPEARDLYRRARDLLLRAMQGGEGARQKLDMARVYAEKAVSKAPESAHALAILADIIQVLAVRGFADPEQATARARELRLEALAADDTVGDVHTSIGVMCLFWEDDFETAGMELERGAELSHPARADGRRHYGAWLKIAGRLEEASREMREAVRLAPEAPFMRVGLADVLMAQGRYAEAIDPLREALRLSPRYDAALERLEMSCHRAGRHDEALDARRMLMGIRGLRERLATAGRGIRPGRLAGRPRQGPPARTGRAAGAGREGRSVPGCEHQPAALGQDHHRAGRAGRMEPGDGLGRARLLPAAGAAPAGVGRPAV